MRLLSLTRVLAVFDEEGRAETLLRAALAERPDEVAYLVLGFVGNPRPLIERGQELMRGTSDYFFSGTVKSKLSLPLSRGASLVLTPRSPEFVVVTPLSSVVTAAPLGAS